MEGMVELAEEVFQLPVRLGVPHYTGSLSEVMRSPIYATGIGLLLFGHQYQSRPEASRKVFGWADQPIQRMRSWFSKYFTEE
jgi:cell division protein FtsA